MGHLEPLIEREPADGGAETKARTGAGDTLLGGWRQGIVANLLNPRMGAFCVAVVPHLITAGASHPGAGVLLADVHIPLAVTWACALIAFARAPRDRPHRSSARRYLDRITGMVIGAFGIRLALGQ